MAVRHRTRSRTSPLLVIPLSLFCLLLIGFGAFLFFRDNGGSSELPAIYRVEGLDPAAQTGKLPGASSANRSAGANDFAYQLNTAPAFSKSGRDGEILVGNPSYNRYLMVLEIRLDGSESVCYQSRFIAPNQYIEKADLLAVPTSPGSYPATAYINAVDPLTLDLVGTIETPITVIIRE